jgi:DNA polymerase/3'-5' exonuclease PolX
LKIRRDIGLITPQIKLITRLFLEHGIRYQICGSIRRGERSVGDCDMVVSKIRDLPRLLPTLPGDLVILPGCGKFEFHFSLDMVQFDLYRAEPENWGAAVLWETGDYWFWGHVVNAAKAVGLKLSRRGLRDTAGIFGSETEMRIFQTLGLPFVPTKKRGWRMETIRRKQNETRKS